MPWIEYSNVIETIIGHERQISLWNKVSTTWGELLSVTLSKEIENIIKEACNNYPEIKTFMEKYRAMYQNDLIWLREDWKVNIRILINNIIENWSQYIIDTFDQLSEGRKITIAEY